MRVAQTQRVAGQEHGRGNDALSVDGERVHRVQNTVFHGIEKLKIADDIIGTERLEGQFATSFLFDRSRPVLEDLQPDTARPGRLNFPGRRLARSGCKRRCCQAGRTRSRQTAQRGAAGNWFAGHMVLLPFSDVRPKSQRSGHASVIECYNRARIGKVYSPIMEIFSVSWKRNGPFSSMSGTSEISRRFSKRKPLKN